MKTTFLKQIYSALVILGIVLPFNAFAEPYHYIKIFNNTHDNVEIKKVDSHCYKDEVDFLPNWNTTGSHAAELRAASMSPYFFPLTNKVVRVEENDAIGSVCSGRDDKFIEFVITKMGSTAGEARIRIQQNPGLTYWARSFVLTGEDKKPYDLVGNSITFAGTTDYYASVTYGMFPNQTDVKTMQLYPTFDKYGQAVYISDKKPDDFFK